MKWNWKEWGTAALIRAVRTFAQCFAACIGTGMVTVREVDWLRAASVSFVAFVLSIMTSLGGLPEVKGEKRQAEEQQPPDEEDTVE